MATYKPKYKIHNTKGRLAWLYNPLRNYRLSENRYKYVYTDKEGVDHINYSKTNESKDGWTIIPQEKFQLVDFDTLELGFKITNPVQIITLPSYDGSVNLILNDGINIPKLINSRFSVTGNDTYEIVDRKGNDDTNIYDSGEQFNIDTSLYKQVDKIPEILFKGVSTGGRMRVGNYHFYFKLMDADGNESDFIGQSQLVSVFVGSGVKSVYTGNKNQNSHKLVRFAISNIDSAYSYISVYYSRATADGVEEMVTEYKRILKKYIINNSGTASISITGFELMEDISERDINIHYNVVDKAKTATQNLNMLFLGNVHKSEINYDVLTAASLQFVATVNTEQYNCIIDQNYNIKTANKGYYDVKNIYNNVGYWPNEYYRFGIVYIMKSGELSPVFNIRGKLDINNNTLYSDLTFKQDNKIKTVEYDEKTYLIYNSEGKAVDENVKGVIKIAENVGKGFLVVNVKISIPNNKEEVLQELKKYVKGFFFVRQKRIPTILCQGLSIGIENESHIPMLPVHNDNGIIKQAISNYNKSHIVYNEEGKINYITEGFLTRYTFKFKDKGGFWKKIGSAMLIGVGAALIAVGSVVTAGTLGVVAGGIIATIVSNAAIAAVVASAAGAIVGAATFTGVAVANDVRLAIQRIGAKKELNGWSTKAPSGYKLVEDTSKSRLLGGSFKDRIIIKSPKRVACKALICPEYTVNLPYYNSIFTGSSHILIPDPTLPANRYFFNKRDRHFYINEYDYIHSETNDVYTIEESQIVGVPEAVSIVGIGEEKFRSKAGIAEEAFRYAEVGNEYKLADPTDDNDLEDIETQIKNKKINSDIVRGIFSPYLGCSNELGTLYVYNIMISEYSLNLSLTYLQMRAEDNSPFYCITERYDINKVEDMTFNIFSGDCYICLFTQRIIRNFNSPSLPYNDEILDKKSWQDNYDPNDKEKYALINLGDVNAVQLGMWVTFKLRSNYNLNIRSIDKSYVDEISLSGHERAFFPYYPMDTSGSYKLPEAQVYNKGFSKSVCEQYNYELPDVPAIKNWFGTRIMYSDIHINDAFRNGFRVFKPTTYRDYTREYGTITKLISLGPCLIAVMEHGILRLTVDLSNITTDSFNNYKNVLPENPDVISKDYGSEWLDSIILTPNGIYGVDTHAKKIWKTDGLQIELISENSVLRFLNENIALAEKEKTPILGRRNVKTLYNQFKGDVMFTFYNIKDYDEVAWNLCYNESMQKFVTFYSWIPSFMENINNIPISFDREMSRVLSIIHKDGNMVELTSPIYGGSGKPDNLISALELNLPEGYSANILVDEKARLGKYFKCEDNQLFWNKQMPSDLNFFIVPLIVELSTVYNKVLRNAADQDKNVYTQYKVAVLFIRKSYYDTCTNYFWFHGLAGIIDGKERIKPTNWYNKQHPFEFEFVVADNIQYLKIFDNLEIIANKAKPESFHYEIVGDCYDFSNDKINMYYRLEALKYIYNFNGANISYDSEYTTLKDKLHQNKKSADFPKTYYARQDAINQIYHNYKEKTEKDAYLTPENIVYDSYQNRIGKHNYEHLGGAEIVWYKLENEFRVWNHAKAVDIDELSQDDARSLIASNCRYLEDKWVITINPLIVCYKNEDSWTEPPVAIYNSPFPEDMTGNVIPDEVKSIDAQSWLNNVDIYGMDFGAGLNRKETDIRGRYIKIRIRYSGEELAIIDFINTIYRISHA